jgi:8-oxo-dGTP pyrophosphatase MutT (NUDIX family)
MKHEKSCGAIVFRKHQDKPKFLLIQHRSGHWGFPKGHVEDGETEQQTAVREVYEETGLKIELLDGFREIIEYSPAVNIWKTVVYFLAEALSEEVVYILPEVVDHKWLPLPEAGAQLNYENQKELLRLAYKQLTV